MKRIISTLILVVSLGTLNGLGIVDNAVNTAGNVASNALAVPGDVLGRRGDVERSGYARNSRYNNDVYNDYR